VCPTVNVSFSVCTFAVAHRQIDNLQIVLRRSEKKIEVAKRINLTGPARVTTGYLTLNEPFELPKGKYAAKVLLRISGTKSLGFVRRDFTID